MLGCLPGSGRADRGGGSRSGAPPPTLPAVMAGMLVLASGSAARLALLRGAGLVVRAWPVALDEAVLKRAGRAEGADASVVALRLAEAKAALVDAPGAVVIGADQLLVCEGQWFDKPADPVGARAQLRALRGRSHVLHTAVACLRDGAVLWRHVARPCLAMRRFSDAFLDTYLEQEGAAVLGCVGAYRLEGPGVQLFDAVVGEHAAVLGLPLLALLAFLRRDGTIPD